MKRSKIIVTVSLVGILAGPSGILLGVGPQVASEKVTAVARDGNSRISATVLPGTAVASARVYFKAEGERTEYYLEMRRADGNAFWAVLPRPTDKTKKAVYRVAIRDADGVEGSTPAYTVDVSDAVKSDLTDEEKRYASNLVIGQTEPNVLYLPPGWQCIGVVSAITVAGELKPNEECRVAAAIPPGAWVAAGAAVVGASGVIITREAGGGEPVSPSRPK